LALCSVKQTITGWRGSSALICVTLAGLGSRENMNVVRCSVWPTGDKLLSATRLTRTEVAHDEEPRMTREQVETALREMEGLREASRLADDVEEQRRLANDYHRLWRKVRPYVEGEIPYSEK
jgi:hypothetical protein